MGRHAVVELSTTAALISPAGDADSVAGSSMVFKNRSEDVDIFIGDEDVDDETGFLIAPGETFDQALNPGETVYAVLGTGTHDLNVYYGD